MGNQIEPNHRPGELARATKIIRSGDAPENERTWALDVASRFRSAHDYPLNAINMALRNRLQKLAPGAFSMRRLKRIRAIETKLRLKPTMRLQQMQDLGGCRAVVQNLSQVRALEELCRNSPRGSSKVIEGRSVDYILSPKKIGYRSLHMIYEYAPRRETGAKWQGMNIELQVRTAAQHAWAAALETVDIFSGTGMKVGVDSPPGWFELFELMGNAIALIEGGPLSDSQQFSKREFGLRLREIEGMVKARSTFDGWRLVASEITGGWPVGVSFIVATEPAAAQISWAGVPGDPVEAAKLYSEMESEASPSAFVVQVSVSSLTSLGHAYPSLFADTSLFVALMEEVLAWA